MCGAPALGKREQTKLAATPRTAAHREQVAQLEQSLAQPFPFAAGEGDEARRECRQLLLVENPGFTQDIAGGGDDTDERNPQRL